MFGFLKKKEPKYEIADIISIILKIKKEVTPGNYARFNLEFLGIIVDKQYTDKEYVYDIDIVSKNRILHNVGEHYIKRKLTDEEVNEYVKNHPDIKAKLDKSLLEDIADELSGFNNIDLPLMTETLEEDKKYYNLGDYVEYIVYTPVETINVYYNASEVRHKEANFGKIVGIMHEDNKTWYTIISCNTSETVKVRKEDILRTIDLNKLPVNESRIMKSSTQITDTPTVKNIPKAHKVINLDGYETCVDRIGRYFENLDTAGRPYGFAGDKKIFIGDTIQYRSIDINADGDIVIDILSPKKSGMVVSVEVHTNTTDPKKPVKYLFTVLPEDEQNTELVLDDCITKYY